MDYSIYKDDNVTSTVDRILKIFNDIGISVNESSFNVPTYQNCIPGYTKYPENCQFIPYSSRISLFNIFGIGANGKGTTKENSRASAYAEFMERLQNQFLQQESVTLCSDKFYIAPDEKEFNEDVENFISKYKYSEVISICQPKEVNNIPYKNVCIPYFNIKDNKLHYLPSFHYIFTANGMSSGNTPEEALVQGFSEVCERYAHKSVFTNKLTMPDIPKKYYKQYERISGLIDYTEQLGWKVYIKDASLGLGLPVICTIFENKKEGVFTYRFGAQPSLPIAIERTITEFFQGGLSKDCDLKNKIFHIDDYSKNGLKYIFFTLNYKGWFFENSEKIYRIFFNPKTNYKFSPSSWVEEGKKYTNKELLKFLVDKIVKITDNGIFVRDVSFLGFPSYHIFIPNISEVKYYDKNKLNLEFWENYSDEEKPSRDIDSLISAILFKLKYKDFYSCESITPYIPDEYLLILCCILKKDYENIIKYCEILKKKKEPEFVRNFALENQRLIDIIYQYFKLKQQKERPAVINNIINNMYDTDEVHEFHKLVDYLDFEYIKNIIHESKEKYEKPSNVTSQQDIDLDNKLKELRQKLIQKYIKNTPNQMELKKVFDFSSLE